jgi:hypothetical protein
VVKAVKAEKHCYVSRAQAYGRMLFSLHCLHTIEKLNDFNGYVERCKCGRPGIGCTRKGSFTAKGAQW